VVKLTRVALLAPLVITLSLTSLRGRNTSPGRADSRVRLVPPFLVGFAIMCLARTAGLIPGEVLAPLATLDRIGLAAALAALGLTVRPHKLSNNKGRPLLLALVAWTLVAAASFIGVLVIHPV
jgi:uncharacterized membrane protein YadS